MFGIGICLAKGFFGVDFCHGKSILVCIFSFFSGNNLVSRHDCFFAYIHGSIADSRYILHFCGNLGFGGIFTENSLEFVSSELIVIYP